ncbi:unnamed protein product [Caenorhabditis auriculariae]|uniref:Ataxin-10 domain-containing protein n=1 Tax=Caenorhabditis auriculariae TaxID=2777116 RepID=A0A8S1HU97_9PELO|nr:unnamed protein product [Caenorhabditis auriculariae]
MDLDTTGYAFKLHPNNLNFCLNYLQRIISDLGEKKMKEEKIDTQKWLTSAMLWTVQIIDHTALRKSDCTLQLFERTEAVEIVVDLLETILNAEAIFEKRCRENGPSFPEIHSNREDLIEARAKFHQRISSIPPPDRPVIPPTPRYSRIEEDPGLSRLSIIFADQMEIFNENLYGMKTTLLACLGNLVADCEKNQEAATNPPRNGLIAALQCTARPMELIIHNPLTSNWALTAIRNLTVGNRKNKEILLNLNDGPSKIINREKLLNELGVKVTRDDVTGVLRLAE